VKMPLGMAGWPKHFLYFSPAKVEALFAQITMRERRRIAHRLELDLKLIKGEISYTTTPENFYGKLRMVLDHLDSENAIGSVREPAQYLAGRLPMTWGTLGPVDSGVVFFSAELDDCSLGLGGSSSNVVGEYSDVVRRSGSNLPAMLDVLRAVDPNSRQDALTVRLLGANAGDGDAWELDAVKDAVDAQYGVTQDVEFVARRLLEGVSRTGDRKIVLGSPLYVALSD
jgi:hypothetical protein